MQLHDFEPELQTALQECLGYLNFSSGNADVKFLARLNALFTDVQRRAPSGVDVATEIRSLLEAKLAELSKTNAAFRDSAQAAAVLALVFDHVWPAYLAHHRDLLAHQKGRTIPGPYMLGRLCEVVLTEGSPWEETDRITSGALARLNDFLGYRPVAVLHSSQKIEPYPHERVRPVPIYIAGAGAAEGPYRELIERSLELLRATDPGLLDAAGFDPERLTELAIDPRAYDFNHPVNKRPNYHFGLWDPHVIDRQGNYRRFVLQSVTLDAILARVDDPSVELPRDERMFEASAVLAGIILMASGTSGSGPTSYDSSVTLVNLLPRIAAYRDAFYRTLLEGLIDSRGQRLREEAIQTRQPFGAARQHLNGQISRLRSLQMQQVKLALLFARMGYAEAGRDLAGEVPVPSSRILCEIECLLSSANNDVDRGRLKPAMASLPEIEDLLHRGIQCGALVDPWNILGFGGQFSLFPSPENSVIDPRVDELLELMEHLFGLYARIWQNAAATDDGEILAQLPPAFQKLTTWWNQFATTTVGNIARVHGPELFASAKAVAEALRAWQQAGSASGDTAFWRPHALQFDSPNAYSRVIDALLDQQDLPAAMALLMHWLSQADMMPPEDCLHGFHALALRWLKLALARGDTSAESSAAVVPISIAKFFDYLEANADTFWTVPHVELEGGQQTLGEELLAGDEPTAEEDEDGANLYQAAYDEMIYRDSTADGNEADMLESGSQSEPYELEIESARLGNRLSFLTTLARLWKQVALAQGADGSAEVLPAQVLTTWLRQARTNREHLIALAQAIERRSLAATSASQESLEEYDRRRVTKESLLEKIIATAVATSDAEQMLGAVTTDIDAAAADSVALSSEAAAEHGLAVNPLFQACWQAALASNVEQLRAIWPKFFLALREHPLLYVPITKGGEAKKIIAARGMQQMLRELLRRLPRLGMLRETFQLIQTARSMERDHPLGAGAVTEFDRLFEIGYKAIVEALIESASTWKSNATGESVASQLIDSLQQITESMLAEWLAHSRTLRLSSLERISSDKDWQELVEFCKKYGNDLFTQRFFHLGNLRAILHQGVDSWLEALEADSDNFDRLSLLGDLGGPIQRLDARRLLTLVLEAVVENYTEYRDYNTTTTQSDRGENIFILLDFLRAKAAYERVHWNLRPIVMAHEVLVRRGQIEAAEIWRRAMVERTSDTARSHLRRLTELQTAYGVRLASIADRLGEKFVRPLAGDRLRALVAPAVKDAFANSYSPAFAQLQREAVEMAQEPTGAGLDLPDWLTSLEDEIDRMAGTQHASLRWEGACDPLPWRKLDWEQIQDQLSHWEQPRLEDRP